MNCFNRYRAQSTWHKVLYYGAFQLPAGLYTSVPCTVYAVGKTVHLVCADGAKLTNVITHTRDLIIDNLTPKYS